MLPQAVTVPGLDAEVEILVDRWGVPHLYAQSRADLFLAQGFNAARDRMFQIDLWLRRGNGRLSEALGDDHVDQDRANRLLRYRGSLTAEWDAYAPGTREAVESFAAGYNAGVAWALEDEERLPPEFARHGFRPRFWEPEDFVRFRTHGLFYNVESELARAITLRDAGAHAEAIRQEREPADPLVIPEGLDLEVLSDRILRTYRLAFAPVSFSGPALPEAAVETTSGSNNWVVSGERTTTGRPVLANDPHRAVTLPSLRYLAHLSAPGIDVIGAGEPGLPGISIGHNADLAFGLTIWPADQEDLVVFRSDPGDPDRVRGPGGWEPIIEESETIPVAGGEDREVRLRFTSQGPVLHEDRVRGIVIVLRAAWLEPGMAPYLASLGYQDARTGEDFTRALRHWGAPGTNQIWAETGGRIGWQPSARIPRRRGSDGGLPVPGEGPAGWDGWLAQEELPREVEPARGWFASANEMNLPEDHDSTDATITYDWYSTARAERLRQWLADDEQVSVASSAAMQSDDLSVHAREFLDRLSAAVPQDWGQAESLRGWDGRTGIDSAETALFEVWVRRHLRPALVQAHLEACGASVEARERARILLRRDESFGGDLRGDLAMVSGLSEHAPEVLARIVAETVKPAIAELESLLGADHDAWTWGGLHHVKLVNTALAGSDAPQEWTQLGPVPRAGTGDTVGLAGYDQSFRQMIGSSFRMALDVGDWDASLAMNAPGQSGDPRSPHYGDHFASWVAGESFPLLYSREAVEAAAEQRIVLVPPA